ncbi:E3.1.11.2 [Mytilus coruscus]|uniref:exodeoxyribonuclease III n=1 Tax=Mytilus coruscus TaxID=42192 RepID=A0A6J8BJ32_MYTCO|nr:E3.1.11.2 [Mytilus coruscus]
MSIQIITLNVNGLRDKKKRNLVFNWLANKRYDLICLQETHCTVNDIMQWQNEWKINGGNKSVWNCGTSDSRGVSILQTKNCPGEVMFDNTSSKNGRIIKCSIKTESAIYHISNIYANNSGIERKQLFESFHNFFGNFTDDSVDHYNILVGDFNCTLDKTIDRNPSHSLDDIGTKELLFLLSQYDLTDIWRDRYPKDKRYTFQRGNSKSRIDYIFCDKSLSNKVYNVGISHCPFSDHDLVSFKLKLDEIQRGPGIWIMNINTIKVKNLRMHLKFGGKPGK